MDDEKKSESTETEVREKGTTVTEPTTKDASVDGERPAQDNPKSGGEGSPA